MAFLESTCHGAPQVSYRPATQQVRIAIGQPAGHVYLSLDEAVALIHSVEEALRDARSTRP
ncbi:hypothetical protein [Rhodococcus sp. A5(2022)]|uniref:hypothetical protein n=1 Tax=Rhodococcus sp. A5(2022) TaxID=3003588 RepID=UPI0022A8121F|nr:hypothetical protein [Rhodococcus sp. A5(2022)]MCZ1075059.1 hypothetical protein [Rhodococcus sp. A5(2022)]